MQNDKKGDTLNSDENIEDGQDSKYISFTLFVSDSALYAASIPFLLTVSAYLFTLLSLDAIPPNKH